MRSLPRVLLLASIAALLAAPLFLPDSYSIIDHTTSESAGQGVAGAWIARAGFVCFGLGVGVLTIRLRKHWNPGTSLMHGAFALCMVGAAVFSSKPWFPADYDRSEDFLHSAAATVMGVCFAIGVVSSIFDRTGTRRSVRPVDAIAVLSSVIIPMAMFTVDSGVGILQRIMFGVAFWWYLDAAQTFPGDRVPPDVFH